MLRIRNSYCGFWDKSFFGWHFRLFAYSPRFGEFIRLWRIPPLLWATTAIRAAIWSRVSLTPKYLLSVTLRHKKKPQLYGRGFDLMIWRLPTLPPVRAVPSALPGLTTLFGMGRGEHRHYDHHEVFQDHGKSYGLLVMGYECNTLLTNNC